MSKRRVVVTGLGIVSPVGSTIDSAWSAILRGESGIGLISRFDTSQYATRIGGAVRDFDVAQYIPPKEARRMDEFIHYGVAAGIQAVTDSGIGISEADQKRIFERFYRVDPSRSRETGGTGLGLAIVKHVASTHNGEVKLFSKPGVGSTFTLRIPLADKNVIEPDSDRSQP